eukprot:TRINITY_DN6925_c0_g1_i2.p1 TRINITY_DN6925_c0_g1~~TRINITY_DN6925_c0_g1_i2.p1  ORF type:complete len:207 (-),score=3.54 TRINITY_DN6925_c0_g1_i2:15-635(-)
MCSRYGSGERRENFTLVNFLTRSGAHSRSKRQTDRNLNAKHLQQFQTVCTNSIPKTRRDKRNLLKTSICELSLFTSEKIPSINLKICDSALRRRNDKAKAHSMQWNSNEKPQHNIKSFKSEFYGKLICLRPKDKLLRRFRASKNQEAYGVRKNLFNLLNTKEAYNKLTMNSHRRNVEYNPMSAIRKQDKIKRDYIRSIQIFGVPLM